VRQDYYATIYFAEIVNALTNLLFLWLGLKGLLSCRKYGHDVVFQVAFCGYLLVGAGSFLFHSTLKCKRPVLPAQATNARPLTRGVVYVRPNAAGG
jgi:dihydroceramidase